MHSTPEAHSSHKVTLITSIVIIWLAASMFGLWWFQQQNVRPFVQPSDNPAARNLNQVTEDFTAFYQSLPQSNVQINRNAVTLIHLWNPECLCNNVSARHISAILDAFTPEQLNFVMLTPTSISTTDFDEVKRLNPRAIVIRQPNDSTIPLTASPALAVFNPSGNMAYFGAYGFGALCSLSDDSLFTNMITSLLNGETYGPFLNIAGSGCFCAWPTVTPVDFSNSTSK